MYWYEIESNLIPLEQEPPPERPAVVLLTSEELFRQPQLSGLERALRHTPAARDVRICKAEARSDYLSGTLILPRMIKSGVRLTYGYLITRARVVLVDDTGSLQSHLKHFVKERLFVGQGTGRFFYELLEQLIAKDLHHLEEIEDQIQMLEDEVLSGEFERFSASMTGLRKSTMAWFRYYSQLGDVACRLRENQNGFFSGGEQQLFHMFDDRVGRLREESRLLREYCAQVQTMFQSEIDIRQNRTMKILTVVTTMFLPLSLLAGGYGMNFRGMPELSWRYGYPAVIAVSIAVVFISLWICKKRKFW